MAWQLCFLWLDEIENHEIITDDIVFIEHYFKITFLTTWTFTTTKAASQRMWPL